MWLQCGRYTLLVFDGIDERPLSGRHVLLWRNPSDQDLLPSNRSFCLFFRRVLLGHWNPEIVCCVYFHPSRLVEIPRGLNLGNISHVSLKNPTSATLLTCSSYSLTDPERNCWRLKFENALSIPPITKKPWKFGKIFFEGLWHFFGNLPDIQLMQRLWQATETFIAACVFRLIKQM